MGLNSQPRAGEAVGPNTDNVFVDPAAEEGFGERLESGENIPDGSKKSCLLPTAYSPAFLRRRAPSSGSPLN